MDAAARLVAQRGFAATSVDDVIREAGLSGKSHFYHYFRSKEALGYAVLDRQFARFAERGLAVLREPMTDPLVRLALFIDALVGVQVARGCREGSPFGTLAAELADAHDGFRARIADVFGQWTAQLGSLLIEARPQLVTGVDEARVARFVIATLEGAMLVARVARDAAALQGIAYDLKRFIAMHMREPGGYAGTPPGSVPAAAPARPGRTVRRSGEAAERMAGITEGSMVGVTRARRAE